jgi:hypothetical protein
MTIVAPWGISAYGVKVNWYVASTNPFPLLDTSDWIVENWAGDASFKLLN